MSEEHHTAKSSQEHGTTQSYVTGFILSLIFTIIPYYLVVNHVLSGNILIATILIIAVVQMAIQLLFFLHLGRGPKPLYNIVFLFAAAGIIVLTIGASIFIMHNLYQNMSPQDVTTKLAQDENIAEVGGEKTGACQGTKESHVVTIKDGAISPVSVQAERCDTLTFINEDKNKLTVIFNSGSKLVNYGGEEKVEVDNGRPETITLNQSGSFGYSDESNATIVGYFYVAQ